MRVSMFCLGTAILSGFVLSGCAAPAKEQVQNASQSLHQTSPTVKQNSVQYYTQRIADQLFRSVLTLQPDAGIAIGTFTQIDSLMINEMKNHPLRLLGLQLEDGFMTASVNRGLKVIEYKTRQKLMIKPSQDLMLSRDVKQLAQSHDIQYFLTGTLTEQETGVVVNARLINTENNQVIAAATDYVPLDTLWSGNKVQLKNNLIYRTGY